MYFSSSVCNLFRAKLSALRPLPELLRRNAARAVGSFDRRAVHVGIPPAIIDALSFNVNDERS